MEVASAARSLRGMQLAPAYVRSARHRRTGPPLAHRGERRTSRTGPACRRSIHAAGAARRRCRRGRAEPRPTRVAPGRVGATQSESVERVPRWDVVVSPESMTCSKASFSASATVDTPTARGIESRPQALAGEAGQGDALVPTRHARLRAGDLGRDPPDLRDQRLERRRAGERRPATGVVAQPELACDSAATMRSGEFRGSVRAEQHPLRDTSPGGELQHQAASPCRAVSFADHSIRRRPVSAAMIVAIMRCSAASTASSSAPVDGSIRRHGGSCHGTYRHLAIRTGGTAPLPKGKRAGHGGTGFRPRTSDR